MDMPDPALAPPAGFVRFLDVDGFIGLAGPYFWRAMGDGAVEYGFRAEARHGNPNGVLHGGSITTFIDTVLGYEVIRQTRRRCATISLTTEFVAGGRPGAWMTARISLRKLTGSMAFIEGDVLADDVLVALNHGIFRLLPPEDPPHQLPGGPPLVPAP
jgi:acyl-coenzyme A thioesterase PaaI-like protein